MVADVTEQKWKRAIAAMSEGNWEFFRQQHTAALSENDVHTLEEAGYDFAGAGIWSELDNRDSIAKDVQEARSMLMGKIIKQEQATCKGCLELKATISTMKAAGRGD